MVSYFGTDFQMPPATCTTSNLNVGASSVSGSFDCTAEITISGSGVKGTFDAHA